LALPRRGDRVVAARRAGARLLRLLGRPRLRGRSTDAPRPLELRHRR
jgi:hypothetical protein